MIERGLNEAKADKSRAASDVFADLKREITYLDSQHIDHSDCSIIFSNIETEFRNHSLVAFLNDEPLEPFADEPVKNLTGLFNINHMNLSIAIGGIGGEIDRKNGIIYYIRSRNEHLPKHIHCKKQSKQCKCIIDTLAIEQGKNSNTHFSTKEQSEIRDYVKKIGNTSYRNGQS